MLLKRCRSPAVWSPSVEVLGYTVGVGNASRSPGPERQEAVLSPAMPSPSPDLVALAGPNGAGKSTVGPALLRESLGIAIFVNADVIAQGLSGLEPEGAAFEAGRIMLERLDELARRRASFAFETTLSGRAYARRISHLLQNGGTAPASGTSSSATGR